MGTIDAERLLGQIALATGVILVMLSPILFFVLLHAVVAKVRQWRGISSADHYTVLDWDDMCGEVIRKRDAEPEQPPSPLMRFLQRRIGG